METIIFLKQDYENFNRICIKNKERFRPFIKGVYIKEGYLYFSDGRELHRLKDVCDLKDGFYKYVSSIKKNAMCVAVIVEQDNDVNYPTAESFFPNINSDDFRINIPTILSSIAKTGLILKIFKEYSVAIDYERIPQGYDKIAKDGEDRVRLNGGFREALILGFKL